MKVGEFAQMLRSMDPSTPIEKVISAVCNRCDGSSGVTMGAQYLTPLPSMPAPAPRGVQHNADHEQIEGIASNSDVTSWCFHDDATVTIEVRQIVTVPIDLITKIGGMDGEPRGIAIIEHLGTLIYQTMSSVGFHCAEVEICRKRGGSCQHRSQ